MTRARWTALVAAIAFIAAIGGVFLGRVIIPARSSQPSELHALLHHELDLDPGQETRIEQLEREFAGRRHALEAELRADNARLAAAIEAEHANGPKVAAAVDASHRAMGELQKATLAHVFAMRQVLHPEQRAAFDRAVTKSLTTGAR